jgi:hypothetical protein
MCEEQRYAVVYELPRFHIEYEDVKSGRYTWD